MKQIRSVALAAVLVAIAAAAVAICFLFRCHTLYDVYLLKSAETKPTN